MDSVDLLNKYKELNESYKPILVYHVGIDAGFFSEFNDLIFMILYCLEHKIQFKLYSDDANFGIEKVGKIILSHSVKKCMNDFIEFITGTLIMFHGGRS